MSVASLVDKTILITGGTGFFGQRFVERLIKESGAKKIIVFSRDEYKQRIMQAQMTDPRLRFFIGDVRDKDRLTRAFFGVEMVVHAAALKQVPALEYNPFEAVATNILGTQNVINAAIDCGVEKLVFISTDKAVNPVNTYGATKMCAERLVISGNAYSAGRTKLSVVRYGNVVGSRGSILDIIAEQKKTGVVTLTHEEMTRFWITHDQGIDLVFLALSSMVGGETFIPKIPSMKIVDVINAIAPNCVRKIIGIRPGEKIHEVLITEEEARHGVEFEKYYLLFPLYDWWKNQDFIGGRKLPENFRYASDSNTEWLTADGLLRIVGVHSCGI